MHASVHGWCMVWLHECMVVVMCVLPGLVRLNLGVGGGLEGDVEEVVVRITYFISCGMENI